MSLIESALEKLRRGEAATEIAEPASAPRPLPATASVIKVPVVPVVREYIHKRITIDSNALRSVGYLPEEGMERRFADHYRLIKRPLIDKAFAGSADLRLIVITSALPGDGKTFTSLNLALSMARERDVSVLLVDADAPRARISEVLGLRGERGLLDALGDESLDVESLIVQTDVRGLEILPAGKLDESAPELIASARMDQISTRLMARDSRQIILFDSAPLLVSSEARALLRVPGQVVLVVRANATPRQAVQDAAAHVDKKKLQGLIINQVTSDNVGSYYGYSHYGGEGDKPNGHG